MQNTFGEFLRNTPPITMKYGLTFPSGRMRLACAQLSGSETLSPIRSSVGYTIDMHESDFSEATRQKETPPAITGACGASIRIWGSGVSWRQPELHLPPRAPGDPSCAESAFALRKFILRGAAARLRLRLGFDPVHGPSIKPSAQRSAHGSADQSWASRQLCVRHG